MFSKQRKIRLTISYLCIFACIVVYVFANVTKYQLALKQNDIEQVIYDTNEAINTNYIKINTLNSRTKVLSEYPNLSINNNVYYLEPNE